MSDITFTFSGDANSLKAALDDIKSSVSSTKEATRSLASTLTAAFAATAVSVAAAFSAINAAAERETLTTAFIPLLGSVDAAQKRMAELAQFAAATPFEINGIAKASKTLQALTNGALATGEGLRLVGDAASVAGDQSSFEEMAVTIGRLYSGLQSGRPIGEAASRLQELGTISASTRAQLEDLQKAGKKGNAVWAIAEAAIGKVAGAMELQSATWSGKVSTMGDAWQEFMVKLGTPLKNALKPALDSLTASFEALAPKAAALGQSLGSIFSVLASSIGTVSSVIVPLVSIIGEFINLCGGASRVVAIVAAAMLIYGSNTRMASLASISLRGSLSKLVSQMSSLSFSGLVSNFKASMASMLISAKASSFGIRTAWTMAMTTIATVTRVSMRVIKAAIVSTGVGALLIIFGEALGALYTWWNKNGEAAQQAADAATSYRDTLNGITDGARAVKTEEQRLAVMQAITDETKRLKEAQSQAQVDGYGKLSDELSRQIEQLKKVGKQYDEWLPKRVKAAQIAAQEAQASKHQREELEKLTKQRIEASKALEKLMEQNSAQRQEDELKQIEDPNEQITTRLRVLGLEDLEALEKERASLTNASWFKTATPQDLERYEQLLATQKAIAELTKKQKDDEEAKAKKLAEATAEYAERKDMLEAEISGESKKIAQLEAQMRLTELTAQLREQGFIDAAARAQTLLELEQKLAAKKAADKAAKKKEDEAEKKDSQNKKSTTRHTVEFIRDSKAAVGGGGSSIIIGGPLLTESKKHTSYLKEVRDALKTPPSIAVTGNVDAVLS